MNEYNQNKSVNAKGTHSRWFWGIMALILLAIAVLFFLGMSHDDAAPYVIRETSSATSPEAIDLNVGQVIDATRDEAVTAREGRRYKVLVVDEAREGASGIARIGGLVTFVQGGRSGDLVVVEVTRLRRSTADAIIIERLEEDVSIPGRPDRELTQHRAPAAASPLVGEVFRGTVEDVGREGDGIVRLDGKVVFVEGARLGQVVYFRVEEDVGRFARGVVVDAESANAEPMHPVEVGGIYDVTITERDRREPDVNGVARIDGLVVFVPGTQPGDHVRVRVSELMRRAARAEIVERLED